MRAEKILALLIAGTLSLGCLAPPAYAAAVEATTQTTTEAAEPERASEVKGVVKGTNVEVGAGAFSEKIMYVTFTQEDDPREHIPADAVVNGDSYALQDVKQPVLFKKEEVPKRTYQYESEVFNGETEEYLPDEVMTMEDGLDYKRVSADLIETKSEEKVKYNETSVTYKGVEAGVQLPETRDITVTDYDTMQEIIAPLEMKSQNTLQAYWVDSFTFPITITGYDADVFMLGDIEVPHSANLADYADELLEYLRLDPSAYRIDTIEWTGPSYEADGVIKRDAVANGSKYVRDIEVLYGGDVVISSVAGHYWSCMYEEILPEEESVLYTMTVEATYALQDNVVIEEKSFWENLLDTLVGIITAIYEAIVEAFTEHPVISSIPLVAVAALITFFIIKKKKNLCIYDNSIRCPYKKRKKDTCKSCVNYHSRQKI